MARSPSRSFKWIVWIIGSAVVLLAVLAAAAWWSIRSGVEHASQAAVQEYPGDRVLALITYAESDRHSFADRNRAVWALGRLRDARALPALERQYVGEPCNHAQMLCQYELKKAINLIRKGHVK